MKKEVYLKRNLELCNRYAIDAMLKRFEALILATDGVLSGNMIWNKIFHSLGIDAEKEILDAFGIHDLQDKIYGIKSVVLYKHPSTYQIFLMFNVDDGNEEEVSARDAAEALAKVYAKLNSLQEKTGAKIAATITTDGIDIESSNNNLVYSIIIPKCKLDTSIDMAILLETAINKIID